MKKISDMRVGETLDTRLLVKNGEIRKTKPPGNKPYLVLELFDGNSSISANHWDFGNGTPPAKNAVLKMNVTVSEWAGNKQLKVNSMSEEVNPDISEFAPTGDFDIETYKQLARGLIGGIVNEPLKLLVKSCFNDHIDLWNTAPSAKGIHHAFIAGNLKHSVDVAIKAKALALTMSDVSVDLCVAGGLLQDLGKLWTYEFNGAVIDMTQQGQLLEHIAIGIMRLEGYRTDANSKVLDLVQHILSSHHEKLEYGSPTTPMFLEAWIVASADALDAKAQVMYEANAKTKPGDVQTEKCFTLNNRQMFTQHYIQSIMQEGTVNA